MALNPRLNRQLQQILPFAAIWVFMGIFNLVYDGLIVGDFRQVEGGVSVNPKIVLFALTVSAILGLIIGAIEVIFLKKYFRSLSFIKSIALKLVIYGTLLMLIMAIAYPIASSLEMGVGLTDERVGERLSNYWGSKAFWGTSQQISLSLLLSLLYAQVSEHLGLNVMNSFFTGKFHRPVREERIFMFVDMKDSTTITEALGDQRYFKFLRDYYNDMSPGIIDHRGEVYQYVGDEIVITWKKEAGIKNMDCVKCFFAMEKTLNDRAGYYMDKYGHRPGFKAGIHFGQATAGEVGALKKEIVYTGDVLNTTARIQSMCRQYKSDLLISKTLHDALANKEGLVFINKGSITLKGKTEETTIYSVEQA